MTHSSNNDSGIWVITSYFNPLRYQSRRDNFQVFRDHLQMPLLTVEQGIDGNFELSEKDSTKLVQISTSDLMWQKERLLNVALENLPDACTVVAWIDCDVLFERQDWTDLTLQALEKYELVQLFGEVLYLKRNADLSMPLVNQYELKRKSVGIGHQRGVLKNNPLIPSNESTKKNGVSSEYSNGFAWAMKREHLEKCRFYDASILGGGDYKFSQAASGLWETVKRYHNLGEKEYCHYQGWAQRFFEVVQGNIGSIPGQLYHLWHGDLLDRAYLKRHGVLRNHDFDPERDIAINAEGCWRWNTEKPALHQVVHQHFINRYEDGRTSQQVI